MRFNIFFFFLLSVVAAFGQTTKTAVTMLREGANNTILQTNASGVVEWAAKNSAFSAGTGITISTAGVITNSSPNTTRTITGGAGITVTGSDPSWTLAVADQSATNEAQSLTVAGTTNPTVTLSQAGGVGGGTLTLTAGSGITLNNSSGNVTITATATAPTLTVGRYEEALAANTTTITVSGFTPGVATMVYLDGVYMDQGSGEDYTVSGNVLTFTRTLLAGQKVVARHFSL